MRSGIAALIGGGGQMIATGVGGAALPTCRYGDATAVTATVDIATGAYRSTRMAAATTVGPVAQQSARAVVRCAVTVCASGADADTAGGP